MREILAGLAMLFCMPQSAAAEDSLRAALGQLFHTRGKQVAAALYDLDKEQLIYQYQADQSIKPASIQKIIISAIALRELGPSYQFQTEISADLDDLDRSYARVLYLRGAGDPSFTIESLWMIVRKLKKVGIKRVGDIVLDGSLFEEGSTERVGQRAYEAGSSALSFNFNSLSFDICPTRSGEPALVVPDPFEIGVSLDGTIRTNSTSKGEFSIDDSGTPYRYRMAGSISSRSACTTVHRSISSPESFMGASLAGLLRGIGIQIQGDLKFGKVPGAAKELLTWNSKPLSLILHDLNHFSNNFIAEQLLFAVGRTNEGTRSREKGLNLMVRYLTLLGARDGDFVVEDASGLSHANRVTPLLLLRVLTDIFFDNRVRSDFEASLPIAGSSGTLKDREMGSRSSFVRAKTGSLTGVSSLAGYAYGCNNQRLAFVLMTNRAQSRESAHKFERDFVNLITRCK